MQYNKIQTIWKRQFTETDPATGETRFLDKGKSGNPIIEGDYSCPEFANIRRWRVDEKLDGMNIRIIYKDGHVEFKGRTDAAQMPPEMGKFLEMMISDTTMSKAFPIAEDKPYPSVILYGEGIGPKIQSGGWYTKEPLFVLFDVWISGWWLKREDVAQVARDLHLDIVPEIGIMEEREMIDFVRSKPLSRFARVEPRMMEGVVCRSEPLMLYRNGQPIMLKLKCKDFML